MNHSSSNPADSWFGRPPPDFARLPATPRPEPAAHLSDLIVNECLNLEAEGEIHEAAARLRRAAVNDPGIIDRFNSTRRVMSALETEVPVGPDLTARIIAGVDERRPFLPRRTRRRVSATRLIAASGVLAALSVAALVQWQPPASPPGPASAMTNSAPSLIQTADPVSPLLAIGQSAAVEQNTRLSFGNAGTYGNGKWGMSADIDSPRPLVIGRGSAVQAPSHIPTLAQAAPSAPTLMAAPPNAAVLRPLLWDANPQGLESLLGLRQYSHPPYFFTGLVMEKGVARPEDHKTPQR